MFLPSFVPCEGQWSVGTRGEVTLETEMGPFQVPDERMELIYSDLLRAREELQADGVLTILKNRVRKLIERRVPKTTLKPPESTVEELQQILASIGPNGQRVMLEICRRIKRGHDAYGDFKPRPWERERRDEFLDSIVYEVVDSLYRTGELHE